MRHGAIWRRAWISFATPLRYNPVLDYRSSRSCVPKPRWLALAGLFHARADSTLPGAHAVYEYATRTVNPREQGLSLTDCLNAVARQGWRIVGVVERDPATSAVRLIVERPKQ